MMYHAFDTHEIIKSFITSGIKEKQAEAIVKAITESRHTDLSNLVTKDEFRAGLSNLRGELKEDIANLRTELKGDIAELKTELKGDIAELRTELKGDIAELRTELKEEIGNSKVELLKWFIGISFAMTVASISASFAFFKLFIH